MLKNILIYNSGGGLGDSIQLIPLILSLSGLIQLENYTVLSFSTILLTSLLMVSKFPTYSLKRILIPRQLAIFLLLGIGIYVSLLIFYTFKTLFFTGIIYLLLMLSFKFIKATLFYNSATIKAINFITIF